MRTATKSKSQGSVSSAESAPTANTEGVECPVGTSGFLWHFSGGTSGTVDFYVYVEVDEAWCKTGSVAITGNQSVMQQAGGERCFAILSAVSGVYSRSYQALKD